MRSREAIPAALIGLGSTLAGLLAVNLSEASAQVLELGQEIFPYWIQLALCAGFWLVLVAPVRHRGRLACG
jgi:hypothetical protein